MFLKNIATLLITFCFSSTGLCLALNKNCMKTQSYVTRYASPPWNSSITFLVLYLCKQKCSSNQRRLNCLKRAAWISSTEASPDLAQVQTSPRTPQRLGGFFPLLVFLSHMSVLQGSSSLFKVESWNFLRQGSGFAKRKQMRVSSVPWTDRTPTVRYRLCAHAHSFPFLDNSEWSVSSPSRRNWALERVTFVLKATKLVSGRAGNPVRFPFLLLFVSGFDEHTIEQVSTCTATPSVDPRLESQCECTWVTLGSSGQSHSTWTTNTYVIWKDGS